MQDIHARVAPLMVAAAGALSGIGCGGSGDDGAPGGGSGGLGTVTDTWREYCTATFTRDTEVFDSFGDPLFTARAGQEFLLAGYSFFADDTAEIVYLAPGGAERVEVSQDESSTFPFTSNCGPDDSMSYYAVFQDVSVYADEGLTTKLCDLTAGTALPSNGAEGFSIAGDFSLSGPQTYELFLGAFSEQCQGAESGYISVPPTELFGSRTWLVPVFGIIGPA